MKTAHELNFNTGDELFQNFCCILQGAVKDDWDTITQGILERTPASFFTAIQQWKEELIMPSACQTMVDYLETITKPRRMTVEIFVKRVKVMARYITEIPFPAAEPPTINNT